MMLRTVGVIAALALGLLAAPPAAGAGQAAKVWRVGLFHVGLDHVPPSLDGLREGLKALGYEEGKNIRLDWRNLPDEQAARETAKEFVRDRVDLIVAFESQTIRAAKAATTEIPVVFLHPNDPVAEGFVKSFSHSGGNLTGTMDLSFELEAKRIELFKEMLPRLRRLLVLIDPEDPERRARLAEARKAGTVLKLRLVEREATTQANIERVFGSVKRGEVQGVFALSSTLVTKFPSLILRLATERRLPVAIHRKEWVERGALFSYGADFRATGRTTARYVDKILKGAKPADLPVEQATRFELFINL
ncbi:MAG TPA: ABC transporter substrate-binding protein, partial [Candidatus Methylomirabilis sp.]